MTTWTVDERCRYVADDFGFDFPRKWPARSFPTEQAALAYLNRRAATAEKRAYHANHILVEANIVVRRNGQPIAERTIQPVSDDGGDE